MIKNHEENVRFIKSFKHYFLSCFIFFIPNKTYDTSEILEAINVHKVKINVLKQLVTLFLFNIDFSSKCQFSLSNCTL